MKQRIVSVAAAAVAVGSMALAAPANADLSQGDYRYRSVMANGVVTESLIRVNDCGPGCIALFNLTTNTDQGIARIQGDRYVLDQFVPHGATCSDGRPVDVLARSTFNPDGTNGLFTLNGPNPCCQPGPVGETHFSFTPA
jgi:hypothetical protein